MVVDFFLTCGWVGFCRKKQLTFFHKFTMAPLMHSLLVSQTACHLITHLHVNMSPPPPPPPSPFLYRDEKCGLSVGAQSQEGCTLICCSRGYHVVWLNPQELFLTRILTKVTKRRGTLIRKNGGPFYIPQSRSFKQSQLLCVCVCHMHVCMPSLLYYIYKDRQYKGSCSTCT